MGGNIARYETHGEHNFADFLLDREWQAILLCLKGVIDKVFILVLNYMTDRSVNFDGLAGRRGSRLGSALFLILNL